MENTEQNEEQPSTVEKNQDSASSTVVETPVIKRFEIAVYDENINDATGKIEYKPVAYSLPIVVEATSPKDLTSKLKLYEQCGQKVKIIREIESPLNHQIFASQLIQHLKVASLQVLNSINQNVELNIASRLLPREIKFYKVGDIEIKDDNGRLYQKQWIKLSDSESTNLRVINDKNNSIVNLNGKHFEMKKWILVENSKDETSDLEENLK